jgi:RNA polymerase sigma-70 factor (ECF subfamily)
VDGVTVVARLVRIVALYIIIPSDLAHALHEPLRRHFVHDRGVHVIVERRETSPEALDEARPAGGLRRAGDGARSTPARKIVVSAPRPHSLPAEVLPHAERLRFFTSIEPNAAAVADAESIRLVARFQQGGSQAFDELYRRHYSGVYDYARLALGRPDVAEDVAQQVFLRVLQALPRFEVQPKVPFRAWVLTIARREVLRSLSRTVPEPRDPEEIASLAQLTGPDRWATTWLGLPDFLELVEELPRRQQQVLMLRYAIGLSVKETAAVMSTSEDAVNSLRRRSLEQLRDGLEELGFASSRVRKRRRMMMRARRQLSPVLRHRRSAAVRGG